MNLREASMNLTEEQYRDYPCLSFSALARYDREGYECIDTLFEKTTTPSLTFGSLVDCLITEGEEVFNDKYAVADIIYPSEMLLNVAECLLDMCPHPQFITIEDDDILLAANTCNYQKNWKDATRVAKIRESISEYYNFVRANTGKIIVSANDVADAKIAAEALKTDLITSKYFSVNSFANREHLYQLQLVAKQPEVGIEYKGMMDLVIVDHDDKAIIPVDLKTTKSIYSFEDSFYKYRYYLQARMYTDLLRLTITDKCPELQNYSIAEYRFVVIDRKVFKPVVFTWNQYSDVVDKDGRLRASYQKLLQDLDWILKNKDTKLPKEWQDDIAVGESIPLKNYIEDV